MWNVTVRLSEHYRRIILRTLLVCSFFSDSLSEETLLLHLQRTNAIPTPVTCLFVVVVVVAVVFFFFIITLRQNSCWGTAEDTVVVLCWNTLTALLLSSSFVELILFNVPAACGLFRSLAVGSALSGGRAELNGTERGHSLVQLDMDVVKKRGFRGTGTPHALVVWAGSASAAHIRTADPPRAAAARWESMDAREALSRPRIFYIKIYFIIFFHLWHYH